MLSLRNAEGPITKSRWARPMVALTLAGLVGCMAGPAPGPEGTGPGGKADEGETRDSSVAATFLDFEFDGELLTDSTWNVRHYIDEQLLYTVGQLNGHDSITRLDAVQITVTETTEVGSLHRVTYHAKVPVAWNRSHDTPETFELVLPRDVSQTGQSAFTDAYSHNCVDWGAHDVTPNSMWYYWRPDTQRCKTHLEEEHVFRFEATVTASPIETTGKYPEYDLVWQDEVLDVVAIFGKYEDGATSNGDAGVAAYNEFIRDVRAALADYELSADPPDGMTTSSPGVAMGQITFTAVLAEGRTVVVHAMLIDGVRSAGEDFDTWYESLTPTADFIAYNGHSGLGANIRHLARKGQWVTGQYAIVLMNGCDTYAYVDSSLWDQHAAANPDDEAGTKYLDLVMNAMPAYFKEDSDTTMAIIEGLMKYDDPETYEDIFQRVDASQVILVSGEQDNVFEPGGGDEPPPPPPDGAWEGLEESGALASGEEKRFETPALLAGTYLFEMTGEGDADLYVRVGAAPTTSEYDCRPYDSSANETCEVSLDAEAVVHVMVRGYSAESTFQLIGRVAD